MRAATTTGNNDRREREREVERGSEQEEDKVGICKNMNLKIHNCIFRPGSLWGRPTQAGTHSVPKQYCQPSTELPIQVVAGPQPLLGSTLNSTQLSSHTHTHTTQSMLTNNQTLIRHVDWKPGTVVRHCIKSKQKFLLPLGISQNWLIATYKVAIAD